MTAPATLILVHGAFCGDWVFWKLKPELDRRGLRYVGTNLPSCTGNDPALGALEDVAYVQGLIAAAPGPVILVGKSYGGVVISGAAVDQPKVAHLVYMAALMPEPGEQFHRTAGKAFFPEFAGGIGRLPDGRNAMDLEVGARCAFSQASEADRDVWRRNASPLALGRDPRTSFERVGWRSVPTTYVVCAEDKAITPEAQRGWAARTGKAIEKPWDHSPGVSHPAEVAELLAAVVRG